MIVAHFRRVRRVELVCALAFGAALSVGIGGATVTELGCSHARIAALGTCAQQAAQQTITVNGVITTIADAVGNAISTGNTEEGILVALATVASEIGVPYALDLIDCALDVIEGKLPTVTADAGTTPNTATGVLTMRQRIAIGRKFTAAQRAAATTAK